MQSCHYAVRCAAALALLHRTERLRCERRRQAGTFPVPAEYSAAGAEGACEAGAGGLRASSLCNLCGMFPSGQQAPGRTFTRRARARVEWALRSSTHPYDAGRRTRCCRGSRHSKSGRRPSVAVRGARPARALNLRGCNGSLSLKRLPTAGPGQPLRRLTRTLSQPLPPCAQLTRCNEL